MERGFRQGEVSYLLIMRLVPFVPFFVANVAPAFLGGAAVHVRLDDLRRHHSRALSSTSAVGAGLGEQISRGEAPDLGVIFEWHVLGPLLGLAALSSLPLFLKGRAAGTVENE